MPTYSAKAVFTNVARTKYATAAETAGIIKAVTSFKVGLGGWEASGAVRLPDPAFTELDIIQDQTRPTAEKRYPLLTPANGYTSYFFSKATLLSSRTSNLLTLTCQLISAEYNSDGVGFPQIGELGLFDSDGDMVVYATFSRITKDPTKALDFGNVLVF